MHHSVRRFARYHGLTQDHMAQDPLSQVSAPLFPTECSSMEAEAFNVTLLGSNARLPEERMQIDEKAMHFLWSTLQLASGDQPATSSPSTTDRVVNREYQMALPLLPTALEADLRAFRRRIEPDLVNERMLPEDIKQVFDQRAKWSTDNYERLKALKHQIRTERPAVSLSDLNYLRMCIDAQSSPSVLASKEAKGQASSIEQVCLHCLTWVQQHRLIAQMTAASIPSRSIPKFARLKASCAQHRYMRASDE